MRVRVEINSNIKTYNIKSYEKIEDLKRKIFSKEGFFPRLELDGIELQDKHTLSYYKINKTLTIQGMSDFQTLIIQEKSDFKIFVRLATTNKKLL